MNKKDIKKIVLAYSGGLDTSIIIPWLKENYNNPEIIAVSGNVGQADELDGLEEKAIKTGASKIYVEDLTEEFVDDIIIPSVKAGAVYEDYLLGTALARPIIAKRLAEIAIKEGNTSGFMTAFNRIGKSTCSTNWSLLEGLIRNEWGFSGHNVTDYMDYAPYRYTNLMVRAGNELPLGGPDKLIGKGKGGVSSYTEGTWDAETNTVLVAADETNALAAEAARVAGGVDAAFRQLVGRFHRRGDAG